jgi:hypothetical protein
MSRQKFVLGFLLAALLAGPAMAQAPSGQPVFQLKQVQGVVLTLAAQGPGTVNSNIFSNATGHDIYCTYNQTAHTGTPTAANFSIQIRDPLTVAPATATWLTAATTSNVGTTDGTAGTTQLSLAIGSGVATSGPTGYAGVTVPSTGQFRVSFTEAGASSTVTGKVACTTLP